MRRYLGLDLGEKRIGVAVSDELGITAQRLPNIEKNNEGDVFDHIKILIDEYKISAIVVGLPRHMSGALGKKGEEAEAFAGKIKKILSIDVITWDERLTTVYAGRALRDMGLKEKKHRKFIDGISAQLLLQSYLDSL